jgi:hypothetical protein
MHSLLQAELTGVLAGEKAQPGRTQNDSRTPLARAPIRPHAKAARKAPDPSPRCLMGWRHPPATWPTMPPLADEPEDPAGWSAWTGCPTGVPLQIAKRGEGRREPSRASGSRPQPHVSAEKGILS